MRYPDHFTKKEMKERDWTKKMFEDYFPEPHLRVPNPLNPDWAQLCLYEKKAVLEVEQTPRFQWYLKWTRDKFRPRMREVAAQRKERMATNIG